MLGVLGSPGLGLLTQGGPLPTMAFSAFPSPSLPSYQLGLPDTPSLDTSDSLLLEGLRTGQLPSVLVGNTEGDPAQNVPGPLTGSASFSAS